MSKAKRSIAMIELVFIRESNLWPEERYGSFIICFSSLLKRIKEKQKKITARPVKIKRVSGKDESSAAPEELYVE